MTILYCINDNKIYFSYPEDIEKGYMSDGYIEKANRLMQLFGISEYMENVYELNELTEKETIILSGILAMFFTNSEKLLEIVRS